MFICFVQGQKKIADLALSTLFLVLTVKMFYIYLFAIIVTFPILGKLKNENKAHKNINHTRFCMKKINTFHNLMKDTI